MDLRSAPRSSRWVANEWRTTCGLSDFGSPAWRPYAFRIFQNPTRLSAPPSHVHEQSRRRPFRGACLGDERRPPVALVPADPVGGLVADRDQSFLVALADAGEVVGVEMQIGGADADQLGHTHARRVEHFDHRAVAQAARRRRRRARRARHRPVRSRETSAAPARRAGDEGPRRGCARGGDRAPDSDRNRVWRPRRAPRNAATDRWPSAAARTLRARVDPSDSIALAGRCGESGQRLQVAIVAVERVRREPALDAQMVEIGLEDGSQQLTPDSLPSGPPATTVRALRLGPNRQPPCTVDRQLLITDCATICDFVEAVSSYACAFKVGVSSHRSDQPRHAGD